jgi:hypothetical protein
VKNLHELAGRITSCSDPYMRFDLERKEVLVLESEKVGINAECYCSG